MAKEIARIHVHCPTDIANRVHNFCWATGESLRDFVVAAVREKIDALEAEHGGPWPQRPNLKKSRFDK